MELLKRIWKWVALTVGSLGLLFIVYFVGRRNRQGEVNLEVASKELERANSKHEELSGKLKTLQEQRMDIVADIVSEATASKVKTTITDEEVINRLRASGLIK